MLIIINFDINIYTHILLFSRWSFLHSAHQVALAHIYIIHLSEEQVSLNLLMNLIGLQSPLKLTSEISGFLEIFS